MSISVLSAFALVALVGIATPGPTVLLALRNGSRYGLGPALAGMFGAAASDVVLISVAALGLGFVLGASQVLFEIVKWAGAFYLAFLGVLLLRSKGTMRLGVEDEMQSGSPRLRSLFFQCFLVAATNPKGYLFFSAFLPQFVDPNVDQASQYATLGLIFVAIDLAVMALYASLGSRLGKLLNAKGAVILDRLCGGTLFVMACIIAAYRRVA